MTEPGATPLPGLPGDNPLGFLAALGVQVALTEQGDDYRLHWTDHPIPWPIVTPEVGVEAIAKRVHELVDRWLKGPALARHVEQTLKMDNSSARRYLEEARSAGRLGSLAGCLIADGGRYKSGKPVGLSKPTDFYFTAATQQFLSMARSRLESVDADDIEADISAKWKYECVDKNSLMWDLRADRQHAYSAADPKDRKANPKQSNAGAEAVAILGLTYFPCYCDLGDIVTQGFQLEDGVKHLTWPLWKIPSTRHAVKSMLFHVRSPVEDATKRYLNYPAWGIVKVLQSQVRRRGQGYGTFGPPRVVWQRD